MDKVIATPIEGVYLEDLAVIGTTGGAVLKMLGPASPLLPDFRAGFGELYFSQINPAVVRAWKKHKKQRQHLTVPMGCAKIGFYDDRADSPSRGEAFALLLGRPDNYRLLVIPPGVWYGFECLGNSPALICNLASIPHDPAEMKRGEATGPNAPFNWELLPMLTIPQRNGS